MKKVLHSWNRGDSVFVKYEDRAIEEISIDWYFLWHEDSSDKVADLMKTIGHDLPTVKEGEYYKVYVKDRQLRSEIVLLYEKHGIQTYEGDLLPDKRWYIDNEIEIGEGFRKLYFDIETDDSNPVIRVGEDRILSFAAIDNEGKTYYETISDLTDDAEKTLLLKFIKVIKNYDIILGWNSSDFDLPYLRKRMDKMGIKSSGLQELGKYDLLKRFRHIFRFDSHIKSFALDYVAKHFLEKGKIEHNEKIIDLWKSNKEKLRIYNIEDCILVRDLDIKLGVSDMMIRQSQWCGVPPAKFGLYSIIDSYILKKAHSIGKYCRTSVTAIKERDKENETGSMNPNDTTTEKSKYVGALVLDPKVGKYDNVYTFDFKGLYPSIMRTSNIGYDSLRYEATSQLSGPMIINPGTQSIKRMSGKVIPTYFVREPSVINLAITDLITKRAEYKNLKLKMIEEGKNRGRDWERVVSDEIIVKELANSTYGIMGLEYGRYYNVDVAESITLFGQWCILFAKKYFESIGMNVIYGDTDSVFVSTGKNQIEVEHHLKGFHLTLENALKSVYNIDLSFIQLNFDKHYDSFILIAKKTYVGHVVNMEGKKVDELYARGLEYHKKNTFIYAAQKQKELIERILGGLDEMGLRDWAMKTERDYYRKTFKKDDLILTQRVGKKSDEYAKTPPLHVRLAQAIKETTGVEMHRHEIDYIIISSVGKMEGVTPDKFDGKYDKDYYWIHKTLPIFQRVVDAIYPGNTVFSTTLSLF